ncbi:MAG: hypothetical protein ACKVQW_03810 [Pyrinomonadaceae bacterium]
MKLLITLGCIVIAACKVFGQPPSQVDFRSLVDKVLRDRKLDLAKVCPANDVVGTRVFREYGAIFVSKGTSLPGKCVFESETDVQAFQSLAEPYELKVGGVSVTLQRAAMHAFEDALAEAAKMRLSITPRGGSASSTRSYAKTVELWNSRFLPALRYWTAKGKITRDESAAAIRAPIREQVSTVLALEAKGLWFSKDLSKSILYSVAVPGASQHNFMLALDVSQFADARVRRILAKHGWFQTVKSDLPHFTYLGVSEDELPLLGLRREVISGQTFWIPNIKE